VSEAAVEVQVENAISEEERLAREAVLTEKMAKMREKNEAIRKRYNEVQEDLKNAQTISSQVKVESGSEDEDKKPVRKATNKTPPREPNKKFTPRRQNSESSEPQGAQGAEQAATARPVHSFGEVRSSFSQRPVFNTALFPQGGGPPPDPGYNFLADEERDGPKDNIKEQVCGSRFFGERCTIQIQFSRRRRLQTKITSLHFLVEAVEVLGYFLSFFIY